MLDIGDKSIQHMMTNTESNAEISTVSVFGGVNQSWSNFHDQVAAKGPAFKHDGSSIKRLSPENG